MHFDLACSPNLFHIYKIDTVNPFHIDDTSSLPAKLTYIVKNSRCLEQFDTLGRMVSSRNNPHDEERGRSKTAHCSYSDHIEVG